MTIVMNAEIHSPLALDPPQEKIKHNQEKNKTDQ